MSHWRSSKLNECDDIGDQDESNELPEGQEPDFPLAELARLDKMINRPRWVVPVLPKRELEVLLDASINLSKLGIDNRSDSCQRFYRDVLTISFKKILTDEAASGWKFEIHRCIMKNCEHLVELCVLKLKQDCLPLLELLAMVLNPNSKFHTFNGMRPSETVPTGSQVPDEEVFARPADLRTPKDVKSSTQVKAPEQCKSPTLEVMVGFLNFSSTKPKLEEMCADFVFKVNAELAES